MLDADFFDRDAQVVARALLGKVLRVRAGDVWLSARIIETEAYYREEKGSHASLGRTKSREALFMPPGTIYMYYARGGDSLNVSVRGAGDAVLIKSAFPHFDTTSPEPVARPRLEANNPSARGEVRPLPRLMRGQTLLCRALGLKVPDWDARAFDPERFFVEDVGAPLEGVVVARRLGIPAGRDEHLMYRFVDLGFVARATENPLTKRRFVEGEDYRIERRDGEAQAFPRPARDRLVREYRESLARTSWPVFQTLSSAQRRREYNKQDRLLDEYARRLPFLELSRCPFSLEALEYPMDPYGFDGLWWKPKPLADYPAPRGGPHFQVLLGAVDLQGRTPTETANEHTVLPGPGAPFVVPQLLEAEGTKAIISQLQLPYGDVAYLVAYYRETPSRGGPPHQPWGRDSCAWTDASGADAGWGASNARWDLDLRPWIERGVVGWILPGDPTLTLRFSGDCPYVGLPGVRQRQILGRGQVVLDHNPSGAPLQPFE